MGVIVCLRNFFGLLRSRVYAVFCWLAVCFSSVFGFCFYAIADDVAPPSLDGVLSGSPTPSPAKTSYPVSQQQVGAMPVGYSGQAFVPPAPPAVRMAGSPPMVNKAIVGNGTMTSNDFAGIYGADVKVVRKSPPVPSLEGKVGGWYVLKDVDKDGKKKCYAVSYPFDFIGNHKNERKPYLMVVVTKRRLAVFIASGYEFAVGSRVFVSVDGAQFAFVTNGYLATTRDIGMEFDFVKAMMSPARVLVYARSTVGSYSVDSYSLQDFANAYKKIVDICAE